MVLVAGTLLNINGEVRDYGEQVPEAAEWPNLRSYIAAKHVLDMEPLEYGRFVQQQKAERRRMEQRANERRLEEVRAEIVEVRKQIGDKQMQAASLAEEALALEESLHPMPDEEPPENDAQDESAAVEESAADDTENDSGLSERAGEEVEYNETLHHPTLTLDSKAPTELRGKRTDVHLTPPHEHDADAQKSVADEVSSADNEDEQEINTREQTPPKGNGSDRSGRAH
jgi:hypothetical protein